jgi:hypothetical protein
MIRGHSSLFWSQFFCSALSWCAAAFRSWNQVFRLTSFSLMSTSDFNMYIYIDTTPGYGELMVVRLTSSTRQTAMDVQFLIVWCSKQCVLCSYIKRPTIRSIFSSGGASRPHTTPDHTTIDELTAKRKSSGLACMPYAVSFRSLTA